MGISKGTGPNEFKLNDWNCGQIVPIVLHRITDDGARVLFEDLETSRFLKLLDLIVLYQKSCNRQKKFLLTFDDCYSSDRKIAMPHILRRGIDAISFVVSDKVNSTGHLTEEEIRELDVNGIEIGSHSKSHIDFSRASFDEALYEMQQSKDFLEKIINHTVDAFSFPYGKFNTEAERAARIAGYDRLFTSARGYVSNSNLQGLIPRNSINGSTGAHLTWLVLNQPPYVKYLWVLEEKIKFAMRKIIGDASYRVLRNKFLGNGKDLRTNNSDGFIAIKDYDSNNADK